jgi:hypothetical protein
MSRKAYIQLEVVEIPWNFEGVSMLDSTVIAAATRYALGRALEQAAYLRCQVAFADVYNLVENLVASEEFKSRRWHLAAAEVRSRIAKVTQPAWKNEPADIEWAYQTLLGRPPESYAAIACWLHVRSRSQIVEIFIQTEEFRSDAWHAAANKVRAKFQTRKDNEQTSTAMALA